MKHNLIISNDQINTTLPYELNDKLTVMVEDNSTISLEISSFSKPVILNFSSNIISSITTLINNNCELEIVYNVESGSVVNEFVVVEEDGINIKIDKDVNVAENTVYEVSNGYFSDVDIDLKAVVNLNGINARAIHNSAVISRLSNKKKFNITINNNNKMTYGELNNFGVVKDKATLVFNGTGYIKNKAIQSQAHQESKIITFDPDVVAEANPYLIIDESDVEASHAAAVGKMDEEQLYYIQSRGINLDTASRLITFGYLKPIIDKITDENLKEKLEVLIEKKVGL